MTTRQVSPVTVVRQLVWKNFLVQRRACFGTLLEILIPVLFMFIMLLLRSAIKIERVPENLLVEPNPAAPFGFSVSSDGTEPAVNLSLANPLHIPPTLDALVAGNFFIRLACGAGDSPGPPGNGPNVQNSLAIVVSPSEDPNNKIDALENYMRGLARLAFGVTAVSRTPFQCAFDPLNFGNGQSSDANSDTPASPKLYDPIEDYIDGLLIRRFDSEAALEVVLKDKRYGRDDEHPPIEFAVVFNSVGSATSPWDVKLVFNSSKNAATQNNQFRSEDIFQTSFSLFAWRNYFDNRVLVLQYLVENFLVSDNAGTDPSVSAITSIPFSFAPFPFPDTKVDLFAALLISVCSLFFVSMFFVPYMKMTRALVFEKELKLTESFKQIGVNNTLTWFSWAVTYFGLYLVVTVIAVLILKTGLFVESSAILIFIWMFLYCLSLIGLAVLGSALFSKGKSAATYSLMLLLALFGPYFAVGANRENISPTIKVICSLGSPTAFGLGLDTILLLEGAFIGLTGDTLGTEVSGGYTMRMSLLMLLFDALLYWALAWYLDKVVKSEYGTQLKWNFLCSPSYWRPPSKAKQGAEQPLAPGLEEFIEKVNPDLAARDGVVIEHLSKVFKRGGTEVAAVKGLSMTMYEGQIFVLLGHNGAGKTTAINMLTGLTDVTSGTARMFGLSLGENMPQIRKIMGVCPQYDVLFGDLTMQEHLRQTAVIKGVPPADIDRVVATAISEVAMEYATNRRAKTLSGGEKRRLSLAMALIGDSKVVFLDEPTSGVDPASRRAIWNLLSKKKAGRVIVLTTHFMDEADQLGDRIAIMHKGQLKCLGSSLFLKRKYGVGYNLTLNKATAGTEVAKIQNMITRHVPAAELIAAVGNEVAFRLPVAESHAFPALFTQIDADKDQYGVTQYGLSVTTLEEVFIRVAHEEDDAPKLAAKATEAATVADAEGPPSTDHLLAVDGPVADKAQAAGSTKKAAAVATVLEAQAGNQTALTHLRALLLKRFHSFKRDKRALCCQVALPMLILILGMALLRLPTDPARPVYRVDLNDLNKPLFVASYGGGAVVNGLSGVASGATVVQEVNPFVAFGDPAELTKFSQELLDARLDSAQSRYGAYFEPPAFDPTAFLLGNVAERIANFDCSPCGQGLQQGFLNSCEEVLADGGGPNEFRCRCDTPGWVSAQEALVPANTTAGVLSNHTSLACAIDPAKLAAGDVPNVQGVSVARTIIFTNLTAPQGMCQFMKEYTGSQLQLAGGPEYTLSFQVQGLTAQELELFQTTNGVFASIVIAFAFAFVPASYVIFIVKERESAAKHLQLISGINIVSYWVSNYVWDFACFLIPYLVALPIIRILGGDSFQGEVFQAVCLVLVFYGLSVIPFTYLLSFLFKSASSAQIVMLLIYIFGGCVLVLVSFALSVIDSTRDINDNVVRPLLRLVPNFCLGDSVFFLSLVSDIPFLADSTPFSKDVSGAALVYMAIESVVYFVLVLLIEYLSTKDSVMGLFKRDPAVPIKEDNLDVDVANEKERIRSGGAAGELIRLTGLRKTYTAKSADRWFASAVPSWLAGCCPRRTVARAVVNDLYFSIPRGECFGFLGVNGAGKTTALKMLTGDVSPTMGTAFMDNKDILTEAIAVRRLMGYCPQFDALNELMSAEETLYFYGRIRGVEEKKLAEMTRYLAERLTLDQDNQHKRPCGTYSGGNKRKLSVAIALIGNPPVVLLDEPSTGMDPVSRRFMWDFISETMGDRSVILTTHSMEECEALCKRIAILVLGELKCLGTSQHLKTRFGQGFQIDLQTSLVSTADSSVDAQLQAKMASMFKDCKLVAAYGGAMRFAIGKQDLALAQIFELMERAKADMGIQEYSVGQTSLEQIFISFAQPPTEGAPVPDAVVEIAPGTQGPANPNLVIVHNEGANITA